ncbi:MAG: hypothetical protein FJ121_11105 [Deltaproteobacteria bacterium]|nr:hypothetical protein [Deltaproteobacteria bacterium]
MGTSSARRGPTTKLWRAAKGAATRYLSPAAGEGASAQEVAARYLAALAETPGQGDRLAAFRITRKAAQDLGAFWQEVATQGWGLALKAWGLAPLARGPASTLAPGVSALLAGSGGGLEAAVVRTALATVIREAVRSQDRPEPAQMVRQFLVTAVHLRLALDLGEPLEAAAGGHGRLRDGLNRIRAVIEAGAPAADAFPSEPPATPGHWQGLTGWTWVTELMAALLASPR